MKQSRELESEVPASGTGQRGPASHERREQILHAADDHFRLYGYRKTTVSDLGRAIGVSSAYIYRFFESKQAIGEAICTMVLGKIQVELNAIVADDIAATEKMRRIYKCLVAKGLELFFKERRLHDIVTSSIEEKWESGHNYKKALLAIVTKVVIAGRETGEFERKTPLDETCRAIAQTLVAFAHPILLEQVEPEELEANSVAVANLVLRSLSP
ncbi:MAG: TetR/AcrR family transcriptional regulator [Candidatus Methylacidiphilales bacterium]|nr:TetR/AcrR family transcriptional regulator [Candidatus Methylacidiphilales bacterium]